MEGFVDRSLVKEVHRIMDDKEYREELVAHNYAIAKQYYSYPILRYGLQELLTNIKQGLNGQCG